MADSNEHEARRLATIMVFAGMSDEMVGMLDSPAEARSGERERVQEQIAFVTMQIRTDQRLRSFARAVERLQVLCERRGHALPTPGEIARLRERHVQPAAFHQDPVPEQLLEELLEIRRALPR